MMMKVFNHLLLKIHRERLDIANVPASFKGTPIALITAGIMACALAGIAGLV